MKKSLWDAYEIAAKGFDLEQAKDILASHETAMIADAEDKAAKEAKKQEKKEKAAKRKSAVADESDDVDMEDAGEDGGEPVAKKASKKRKKDVDSDGETEKVHFTCFQRLSFPNGLTHGLTASKDPQDKAQAQQQATKGRFRD